MRYTAWKMPVFGKFVVRNFPHSDWIRRDTPYLYMKNVRIWKISGPYFPAFGLNTERYSVSLRIQSECGKTQTRKTSNRDTFNAVIDELNWIESFYFMLTKNTCSISRWVWNTKRKKSYIRLVMKVSPLDTRHGLCLPQTFRGSEKTFSERLLHVQFRSCIQGQWKIYLKDLNGNLINTFLKLLKKILMDKTPTEFALEGEGTFCYYGKFTVFWTLWIFPLHMPLQKWRKM